MKNGGAKGVVVERVLAAYGLEGATVERITGGFINQTYQVRDGDQTYALRRHRRENRDFIAREHLVMLAAGEAGVPTPTIIPTRAGEPVSEVEGALWSLLTWLPGEAIPASRLDGLLVYRLGQALARAHQALRRLDTRLFPGAPQHSSIEPDQTLEALSTFARLIALGHAPHPFDEQAKDFFAFLEPRLKAGSPALGYYRSAARQVLHGDVWTPNVLFTGAQVTGFLDWEYACVAPPLWELAYVFGCWLFVLDDLTRTIELTCQFLAGYCREVPLPATELGRIPELYRWFRLNHMGMFYNHYVLGDHRTDAFLAGNIRQISMVEAIGLDLEAEIIRRLGPAQ